MIARLKDPDADFPHGSVVIGVRDQGIGMSLDFQQRIGELFLRADGVKTRNISGSGIGLYLVKALVTAHNGIMTVESTPGEGSTFWVRLPLWNASLEEPFQRMLPLMIGTSCS